MSLLKSHLQSIVTTKVPQAFALKKSDCLEITATAILPLDALIQGFPHGGITEIYGPVSSGRTTIAFSFMAEVTRRQQVCAVVDAFDSLDPESLAAAGVDLKRVLWVRCGQADSTSLTTCADSNSASAKRSSNSSKPPRSLASSSRHPRNEVRGLSHAVANFMGNLSGEQLRTCPIMTSPDILQQPAPSKRGTNGLKEQISADRLPPRRGDTILAESSFRQSSQKTTSANLLPRSRAVGSRPDTRIRTTQHTSSVKALWARLEQALKVTDLLLHNGGFGAVVMDLGDVPPANARRIPLTSWFRFRRAIENTSTAFVLLTREPCAQTCASLVLHCERRQQRWSRAASCSHHCPGVLLNGMDLHVEVRRHRSLLSLENLSSRANATCWQTRMRWTNEHSPKRIEPCLQSSPAALQQTLF
jgi:recombination protein RecA